jgi:hypothetical protein
MTAERAGFILSALLAWLVISVPIGMWVGKGIAWDTRAERREKARQP